MLKRSVKPRFIAWGCVAILMLSGSGAGLWLALAAKRGFTKIPEYSSSAEAWRQYFPLEYDSWQATADTDDEAHNPLADNPRLAVLRAGDADAPLARRAYGHANALARFREFARDDTPAAELVFYSSDVPRLMHELGAAIFYQKNWRQLAPRVGNPVSCLDCHNPKTMRLTVTRPYLAEAYAAVTGRDIRNASKKKLRSLSCAQCHAQYYLDRDTVSGAITVKLPWSKNGYSADAIERYYDRIGHHDYIHAISKTPMLKARHPDFELASSGAHARRGLSCADCHMPTLTVNGREFRDHQTRNPLQNMSTCLACHKEDGPTLEAMVEKQQQQIGELRGQAEDLLIRAHYETRDAAEHGASDEELATARRLVQRAQWRWDFVSSSRGAAFHAPDEAARILSVALDQVKEARRQLSAIRRQHGRAQEVPIPVDHPIAGYRHRF
ncbi:MAG: ammonia-forming cytochrome c nitrite reductase subunit c552 [Verrucomicrobiales bacterium]|jgi:nitrite reductase (cytochrome c-552)|nr:ammonia-forming cytochrome c nitrite reductase subunit c552 [Verrucomicrobiales bacterium]